MSKGSNRRPSAISRQEWDEHWAETFGGKSMFDELYCIFLASHPESLDTKLPPEQVNDSVNRSED